MSAWGPVVTAVDVFRDPSGRAYAAGWRFDPARPLEVALELTAGDGVSAVWRLARELLDPDVVGPVGGDVALIGSGPRLVVLLYPLTLRAKTLTGSGVVALEFLAATEALVPRCAGCQCPRCRSCAATGAGLEALLAEIAQEPAPRPDRPLS
ncbi:MAG TPA: SsgA family sporulation/cell division regulator [Pseudonocardiaceae bacterium]|jgi:hypothetical protein|nr:SsgA family sporulation/cell division regulator [Pseudonocardiaceae bacterium]